MAPPPSTPGEDSMVVSFIQVAKWGWVGVQDGSNMLEAILTIAKNKDIRKRTWDSIKLNGLLFLPAALFYDYALYPMLAAILDLPAPWSSRASPVVIQTLAAWLEPLYSSVFFVACILPILLVTLLLSSAWYQEIADVTFALDGSVKAAPKRPAWEQAAEVIYRTVVVLAYVVLQVVVALLLCAVPFVGPHLARAVDMILTAWYFAFLCFEYKWINIGSDLSKRIIIFHARWAYFAGFGLPFTLLCYFSPLPSPTPSSSSPTRSLSSWPPSRDLSRSPCGAFPSLRSPLLCLSSSSRASSPIQSSSTSTLASAPSRPLALRRSAPSLAEVCYKPCRSIGVSGPIRRGTATRSWAASRAAMHESLRSVLPCQHSRGSPACRASLPASSRTSDDSMSDTQLPLGHPVTTVVIPISALSVLASTIGIRIVCGLPKLSGRLRLRRPSSFSGVGGVGGAQHFLSTKVARLLVG
ncbi:etoposide-induced protein 2.4 [Thecamonas trahens ATCC 50062]|uniref:Etoposide-induced protein 2.4 n=1 Tax=Thecamonas trahens ATCC 50062 TaxID=461836 RepID=A0A0L0DIZ3_THETB|nr:etoposide-induced protein 2.4 [Thecamonas trahens ATCC 50062]KNC52277.1 etoposide-induced protein 2.4 [Thecamonas trahens ATCC 50062]|eukprot:XP_013762276.1 etoposide-induced protein 2.4 [Thecamonas trahens ATCC 50062]